MSSFTVDTTVLLNGIDRLNKLPNTVSNMIQDCRRIKRALDWDVMGEQQLEKKLDSMCIELEVVLKSIARYTDYLINVKNIYTECQAAAMMDIIGLDSSISAGLESFVSGAMGNSAFLGVESHVPGDCNKNFIPDNEEWKQRAYEYNKRIDEIDLSNKKYKATYKEVIEKDKNGNEIRKTKIDKTYCNVYVKDVMNIVGAPLPKYVDERTMELVTDEQKKQFDKEHNTKVRDTLGYRYTNANCIARWLDKQGEDYGWIGVSPTEAQEMANKGYPAIAVWDSGSEKISGHVAVVRPYDASEIDNCGYSNEGVYISQAGANNYEYTTIETGFGEAKVPSIKYYYYKRNED